MSPDDASRDGDATDLWLQQNGAVFSILIKKFLFQLCKTSLLCPR